MLRSVRHGILAALVLAVAPTAQAADVSVRLDAASGFSVRNNTGAIERLRVDEATGNISRNGALFIHTSGVQSLFVGVNAGNTASGGSNVGVGPSALQSNTTGFSNTAVGQGALTTNSTGVANSAVGAGSLIFNTTGAANSAFGVGALLSNTAGSDNSAVGADALRANTTGQRNTAVGRQALFSNSTPSDITAVGFAALNANAGTSNSALGSYAMFSNSSGYSNSAFGESTMLTNTTGAQNSAFGWNALHDNTTGGANSAVGSFAIRANTTGGSNVGVGQIALRFNTTGSDNTALGRGALYTSTAGSRNVAVGSSAGYGQTTGNDNIYIASTAVAGESGRIRIGTAGTHTQTQIAGIHGATSGGGIAVLVNASGTLGTTTSSARFKRDVEDLGDASDLLMRLRPVRFHYLEEAVGAEESKTTQYGLIAEEVAEVAPELVAPGADGKPYSVKYHVLPALLLGELQRQKADAEAEGVALRREIAGLKTRLARLETGASGSPGN